MMGRVLAVVALALVACGGASGGEGASAAPDTVSLAIRPTEPLRSGAPVVWRLVVSNPTEDTVVLTFPSGQQGDVVLRGTDGQEAYRWSEGIMFTAAVTEVALAAGGEETFTLAGTLDVEPGGYVLEATVPADPAPEPLRADVTVEG